MDMDDSQLPDQEPANLKFLRLLVTVLTAVMIGGVVIVIALLVMRLSDDDIPWPESITLPEGIAPQAVTAGKGWVAVVTQDDRILIYDTMSGALRQEVRIDAP